MKASDIKDALTKTLITKMRSKFKDIAPDVVGQELISREVTRFMQTNGSVREDDLGQLEEYVKAMLIGEEPKKQHLIKKDYVRSRFKIFCKCDESFQICFQFLIL